MKIGVLGTGMVGTTIASALAAKGHAVKIGARQAGKAEAVAWAKATGGQAGQGSFADAAAFGELLFNCTKGEASLAALQAAGAGNLAGKVLVDLSNPLDFSKGMPPSLFVTNTDSLAEQIQRAFPQAKVVKTLNTLNCFLMVQPGALPGPHNIFISGDDAQAKQQTLSLLTNAFGWKTEQVLDLGPLSTARATEGLLALWVRLYGSLGHANFNFHLNIGPAPKA
jgi:8-hydroxy-5-deazaflavin:NADPH oxidoreductase